MTPGAAPAPRGVLFVSASGGHGGPVQSLLSLIRGLDDIDRIAIGPWAPEYRPDLLEVADEVLDLPRPRGGGLVKAEARMLGAGVARRSRIDLVHANSLTELALAMPLATALRVPTVVWVHNWELPRAARLVQPLVRWRRRHVHFAAVSDLARRLVSDNGLAPASAVRLIPNPIEPAVVAPSRPVREEGPLRIGYFGTDRWYKGFDLLPDAVEGLRDRPVQWLLYSAPHATDQVTWRRLVTFGDELVSIRGRTRDVASAYANCDIVFIPSREESFCRVAAEAMCNGIPVVTSDLDPVLQVIGSGSRSGGLSFPSGDMSSAVSALRLLLDDEVLRKELGDAGRAQAHRFEPAKVLDQFRSLYAEAMTS